MVNKSFLNSDRTGRIAKTILDECRASESKKPNLEELPVSTALIELYGAVIGGYDSIGDWIESTWVAKDKLEQLLRERKAL